jgi:hypothetical protein
MFTKESFEVISCTDIPKVSLLKKTLKQLQGREIMFANDESEEQLYSGDVFEAIASELAEMEDSPLLPPQEVIDQINNLAEIINTDLVRITDLRWELNK